MELQTFLLFAMTTALVNLSPGPTAILMASQGAGNGTKRALFALLGIYCATAIYYALSATGIASLIVASNTLFQFIKWAGVCYIFYLGLTALFSKSGGLVIQAGTPKRTPSALFTQGFLVEFSNPKALLYFSAILPQFLDLTKPIAMQFLIMWATSFVMQSMACSGYAYLGERLVHGSVKRWVVSAINKIAGGALIFAGLKMTSVSANR